MHLTDKIERISDINSTSCKRFQQVNYIFQQKSLYKLPVNEIGHIVTPILCILAKPYMILSLVLIFQAQKVSSFFIVAQ